ncbi:MAG: MBL fold metallo-hydrolase [Clostridia bacterium]|nr:MBL fold metallo-hydrolase [Clostridia bacterium]
MKLKFLGTGAADWKGTDERGECRRLTSTLLDGALLIDVTATVLDEIPDPAAITDVFFTHSHGDHFNLDALRRLAPCRVYAHESWAGEIAGEGLTVAPLRVGQPVEAAGFTMIPMPSNHSTQREDETTLHYLIEKDGRRLLYATDGAWLLNREHHIIGKKTLDAAVFDATIGDGHDGDFRIFEHNSIDMVRLMRRTMVNTGRLPETAPVFLTHLARTLHGTQAELERQTEKPFVVCYDGMEAEI